MSDPKPERPPSIPVCGIGASAGGIEALQHFFGALPNDLGLAYVVIVHLAPDRKSELPAIIARWTTMRVVQVGDHEQEPLAPNNVYVIAPDRKLEITDSVVGASPFDQPRGQRTAIDLFFRSLAAAHGDGFAVVLSGTGSDGAVGARAVKERGGVVLVQDPAEASHGDMPLAAISTGVADVVLPVRELAARLVQLAHSKNRMPSVVRAPDGTERMGEEEERAFRNVLDALQNRTGQDFSKYKRSTVLRRLSRRMQLTHQLTIADYLGYLRSEATEARALFDDLLISVTTFFRDPDAWAALQTQVIARLVEEADVDAQIRVWVPACSTGEEAYTLGILFHEEFVRQQVHRNLIIFASDVDEGSLRLARDGVYPHAISADVSDARLDRYFRADDSSYRISGDIRDHVVFAEHSVLRDPPFSRLDLISCRNLLIYLDRELQDQVMNVFRYACRNDAYLFLGSSESADEELFRPIDKKHRLFATRQRGEGARPLLPGILAVPAGRGVRYGREGRFPSRSTAAETHLAALEDVAPPTVVVDERGDVVHLSVSASRFFQQRGGTPARRLTDLVRPELRDELHMLLQRALETTTPQLSTFVAVAFNGGHHKVAALAQQRPRADDDNRTVLVTFLDAGEVTGEPSSSDPEPSNALVRSLREKLQHAEQRIDGIRDDYHLTNEDLRAANEELQSLNEEYRSTTEELETSKEELQSINEELHTVNHELKMKLEEVSRAHSDLENLMAATNVATLFLNPELRIKRFTPQLGEIFNIKSRDLERPIADLTHTLDYATLEVDAQRVLATLTPIEHEASSRHGQTYVIRLAPYRTGGGRIDGVVVTFVNVTAIKKAESELREGEQKLEAELNIMRRLHRMTLAVATAANLQDALGEIILSAIELHTADSGSVQLLDPVSQQLRIVAQQGFRPSFLRRYQSVGSEDETSSGRALRTRRIVQISDVTMDAGYASSRGVAEEAGYRAVQSTPLINRNNEMVGVLSVHFHEPHGFSERDTQFGDVLGRQAADLIESRAQQDSLRQLNETLNRRTAELEASQTQLSQQAADLLQQDRHREDFLAALGHELRNPMAAVHSSLALISVSDDRSQRALAVLHRQTRHLTRLINDLLDITRVKHGRLRLERAATDVNQSVLAAIETVRPQAESKGLTLNSDLPAEPLSVDADPERLAQILDNLLRNAVSYTDVGDVTITVRPEPGVARISVRDTGVGIDPGDGLALFQPYQQRGEGYRTGGLGLGLTLVKALVEAHKGTITFRSAGRGTGSEFIVTIPLAQTAPVPARAARALQPAPRRILVVDDQEDVADMFGVLLTTMGQDVRVAYDGATAILSAREHRPHVAFLDVSMPVMSGSEVARRLRQLFPANELTLVAITGHDRTQKSVQEGPFDHHLLKPVTEESVVTLLNGLPFQDHTSAKR